MEERTDGLPVPERIASAILVLRGQRVILDSNLADLYGVPVRTLLQAVERNLDRFPTDFMFQMQKQEVARLRSQTVISNGILASNATPARKLSEMEAKRCATTVAYNPASACS